ncbi:peptidoglycan-binding protein [Ilumatobacter sp.]|uniref:peptidoglycan-binding protein n=1 Tax=Ilumatobacter sp. TaxID=1967498 RepID=UPI003B52382D
MAWTTSGTTVGAAPAQLVSAALDGLRQGARGDDVRALQTALISAGVDVAGGADGIFGPATARAVSAFQRSAGLPVSGSVDRATAEALTGGSSAGAAVASGLAQGASGSAVRDLQRALIRLGVYLSDGADGEFGPGTTRGVRQFQSWNGLTVTGSVDAATARRLGLGSSSAGTRAQPTPTTAPAPTGSASSSYAGLARGASGALVRELQTALQATGLVLAGGADGDFGPATERALKVFQRVNGRAQTGVVGEREVALMGLGASTSTAPTPPPASASPYVGLARGASGAAVQALQRALVAAGVDVRGGADGAFGPATESALATYQGSVGLKVTGRVDQPTIDKLGLGTSRRPAPFASTGGGSAPTAAPSPTNGYVGLSVGSRGPLVVELQNALQSTGLVLRGGVDGDFGPATRSALVFFQKVNGMSQTGVVTERQANLLGLGSGSVPQTPVEQTPSGATVRLERFPVQGQCFFGDTWGAARGGGRTHEGVDIIAAQGKFLYAVVDGTVSKMYWDQPGRLSGNGLRIAQGDGTYFTYLHLYAFAPGLGLGTKVKAGDVIGFVGTTGSSATPHLHFEIHPGGGRAVNPYPYVKAIDDCNNTDKQYQGTFS